jgi:NADH:ubiquinone oxidoreductase subunit F (NADH-binding)/(2Fe-2S) ferredoxin/NAD-dependent dihydropyrimidine dehydrogenase PreA subunit
MRLESPQQLIKTAEEIRVNLQAFEATVSVCGGTGCVASGCRAVAKAVEEELNKRGLREKVRLLVTGCHGFCQQGPIVVVRPGDVFYSHVDPKWVPEIIEKTVINHEPVEKYLYKNPKTKKRVVKETDVPFYKVQTRPLLGNNAFIDPTDIRDYIGSGGYQALAKALFEMNPDSIVDEIKKSGLRGRGGGGFPTGRKWDTAKKATGAHKWVICNADEGDPGAFMDEAVLEGNPHLVVEGMVIGARAVGAHGGYVYVRNEYPLALKKITLAIEQAREWGLLGKNILGSGFDFDIKVNRGGGAFVCGESTALMASLEGKQGEPRAKYIHTVEHGYHDEPTVLNNVETWANAPAIILDGASKFRELGTEGSPGTKIFSLVGKVNNTGLVEIPMGMSLRTLVEEIGGGVPKKRQLKAVQTGGPSGGCLPDRLLDLPVDFDELSKAGSMMGSGGIIVMDENTCMVDVARYFIRFLRSESCGKCTPCREGLAEMDRVLTLITEGHGTPSDLDYLDELSRWMEGASLCALGTTAANPVASTLHYFRDEYITHITECKCPGGVCRELLEYRIDSEKCTGCTACVEVCPVGATSGEKKKVHNLDAMLCIKCGACFDACNFDAIKR